MSKQVSLFKFYGNKSLKSKNVVKSTKSSEAETNVTREVRILLKDVVQKVVAGEVKTGKSGSDETYSALRWFDTLVSFLQNFLKLLGLQICKKVGCTVSDRTEYGSI